MKMDYLLIIDPQNDFMDLPGAALPVKGAMDDMERLAQFIKSMPLDGIMVSMDSHSPYDIGHACFWTTPDGAQPAPFTVITAKDVADKRIYPIDARRHDTTIRYLELLATRGRYQHTVWPNHCEPGTWGHQIPENLLIEINQWSLLARKPVDYIFKGTNPYTESYSAFEAEVPLDDPSTQKNITMLRKLMAADRIFVAGEALSHCVKSSMESLLDYVDSNKIVLLEDCMSAVLGFEGQGQAFLEKMKSRGARVMTTTNFRKTQKCQS